MGIVLKIVVTVLTVLVLSGVLFPGPAFAGKKGKRPDVKKAEVVKEEVREPASDGKTPPTISESLTTTDQCFEKYSKGCELETCLLTLERETPELIRDSFGRCLARGESTAAVAAPPTTPVD